jgi:cytochrome c-type biogenesis protein CcmH/NrfG
MNVPFGGSLTAIATLPPGSDRDMADPYAEKKSPWPKVILLLVVLVLAYLALDHLGFVYQWTNGRMGTPIRQEAVPPAPNAPTGTPAKPA